MTASCEKAEVAAARERASRDLLERAKRIALEYALSPSSIKRLLDDVVDTAYAYRDAWVKAEEK